MPGFRTYVKCSNALNRHFCLAVNCGKFYIGSVYASYLQGKFIIKQSNAWFSYICEML